MTKKAPYDLKLVARLVVHGMPEMSAFQRGLLATWLRQQARAIEDSGNYGKRYTARYWV